MKIEEQSTSGKHLFPPTHGKSNTRLYRIWTAMKTRCYTASDTNYKYYGGRGIEVCDEWNSDFMSFYAWATENGYQENLTIDRIDNDGKYEPQNCRWTTMAEQNRKRRHCRHITVNGITKLQKEWADTIGISDVCIIQARKKGKNVEQYIAEHLQTN